jgi:hypothetical protein
MSQAIDPDCAQPPPAGSRGLFGMSEAVEYRPTQTYPWLLVGADRTVWSTRRKGPLGLDRRPRLCYRRVRVRPWHGALYLFVNDAGRCRRVRISTLLEEAFGPTPPCDLLQKS